MQSEYEHKKTEINPNINVQSKPTTKTEKSPAPKPSTNKITTANSPGKNTNLLENIKKLLGFPDNIAEKKLLLLSKGIVTGLKDASVQTVGGLIKFLSHPINNTKNILEVISSPEGIAQLGKALVTEFHTKIQHVKDYLSNGDKDDNTVIQLGKDLGEVIWEAATTLVGVGATMGIAKGGVKLAKMAVKSSESVLEGVTANSATKIDYIVDSSKVVKNLAPAKRSSTQTVLGRYPAYVEISNALGARRFEIPANIWDKMTPEQQWNANKTYLDRMIAKKDEIVLATPVTKVQPGTFFAKEINYLKTKGYQLNDNDTKMILKEGK